MKRMIVAAAAVIALAAFVVSPPRETLASWTDTAYGTGGFTAYTVPRPVFGATCTLVPGFLGTNPVITVTWTMPAGYTLTNVSYGYVATAGLEVITGGLLSNVVTSGGPTAYSTNFNSGLLGGLLGGSKTVGIRINQTGTGWYSAWSSATASMGLAGINPTCVVNP